MNYDITDQFELLIKQVFDVLEKPIDSSKYSIVNRGIPHKPVSLPKGKMGIYTFYYNGKFLKIGKAGQKSGARFLSQHYSPKSANSNLALSILSDANMSSLGIDPSNISEWIKNNCQRVDILLDESLGIFTLQLIESILHYKYEPTYEGFSNQR